MYEPCEPFITKHASGLPLLDLESEIIQRYHTHGYMYLLHMDINIGTHGCRHIYACVLAPSDVFTATA